MSDTTDLPTLAFLHAHGIDAVPESLSAMMELAISRLKKTLYPSDPRADLSPAEVAVLERGGANLDWVENAEPDPLATSAARYAALLQTSLSTNQAARRLGVDPSRIRQRLLASPPTLYGIRQGSRWFIPEFQFDGDHTVPGFEQVLARLDPEEHPLGVCNWFTLPHPDLQRDEISPTALSPREWLRMGLPPEQVADLAEGLEQS